MTISRVIWCKCGWLPYHYGFCPDAAAWRREMKRLKSDDSPYPDNDASVTHFEDVETMTYRECSIVTVSHRKRSASVILGVIVHEAMHIWRKIRQSIGEHEPSLEFEAYALQNITMDLIHAYEMTRGRLCI